MTTTTGDPSSLKTPASLSGGDLVSRLLAATPPYLYNVPLTPHSFFFSEMLRSFVQSKSSEASTSAAVMNPTVGRRRKRSWRDARDRPLELTTKEKLSNSSQQQQHSTFHQDIMENRFKSQETIEESNKVHTMNYEQKTTSYSVDNSKAVDENPPDFIKQSRHFFDDSSRLFGSEQAIQQHEQKNNHELGFLNEQKPKIDFSARNLITSLHQTRPEERQATAAAAAAAAAVAAKNFGMIQGNNSDFVPGPLWYPPYPLPQNYPGIDPLHFFIDLRVSGHIWDRKMGERQLSIKGKHCSAFSVPQTKEYNRPLNLTRDEAGNSRGKSEKNPRGTHFIMKHLTRTYKDIEVKNLRIDKSEDDENQQDCESGGETVKEDARGTSPFSQEENANGKDLRALIDLELVVDYVKEPKEEPVGTQSPKTTE